MKSITERLEQLETSVNSWQSERMTKIDDSHEARLKTSLSSEQLEQTTRAVVDAVHMERLGTNKQPDEDQDNGIDIKRGEPSVRTQDSERTFQGGEIPAVSVGTRANPQHDERAANTVVDPLLTERMRPSDQLNAFKQMSRVNWANQEGVQTKHKEKTTREFVDGNHMKSRSKVSVQISELE